MMVIAMNHSDWRNISCTKWSFENHIGAFGQMQHRRRRSDGASLTEKNGSYTTSVENNEEHRHRLRTS